MGSKSKIEWLRDADGREGATWNPTVGCSRVSAGCGDSTGGGCYAERQAIRLAGPGQPYEGLVRMTSGGPRWTGVVRLNEKHLEDPLHWQKPRRIFVDSMSDLFHEKTRDQDILRVFDVIRKCYNTRNHTFIILTKRARRMYELCSRIRWNGERLYYGEQGLLISGTLTNLHLGVSVENKDVVERIEWLLKTPASTRIVSYEPALGPVNFVPFFTENGGGIDQIICGAESGPRARPMNEDWVRSVRDQCRGARVAFFYKQNLVNGRKVGLPILDGEVWNEYPTGAGR